jgi:hypothetical protein
MNRKPTPAFSASSGWVSFTNFRLSLTKSARFILYPFGYKNSELRHICTLSGVFIHTTQYSYPIGCNWKKPFLQIGSILGLRMLFLCNERVILAFSANRRIEAVKALTHAIGVGGLGHDLP